MKNLILMLTFFSTVYAQAGVGTFTLSDEAAERLRSDLNVEITEDDCGDRVHCGYLKSYTGGTFMLKCETNEDECSVAISVPGPASGPKGSLQLTFIELREEKAKNLKTKMKTPAIKGDNSWIRCDTKHKYCTVFLYSDLFVGY